MAETILVVNAGSSSLKFKLFEIGADRTLAARLKGQVDGVGARPRLRGQGTPRAACSIDETYRENKVRDLPEALACARPAHWPARGTHAGRARAPRRAWRAALQRPGAGQRRRARRIGACSAPRAAAPAQQPGADHGAARACTRHARKSRVSTRPSIVTIRRWRTAMQFRKRFTRTACAAMASTVFPTSTWAAGSAKWRRIGGGPCRRRPSRQRRLDVRDQGRPQRRQHDGLHGTRWSADGHTVGPARPWRGALSVQRKGNEGQSDRAAPLP